MATNPCRRTVCCVRDHPALKWAASRNGTLILAGVFVGLIVVLYLWRVSQGPEVAEGTSPNGMTAIEALAPAPMDSQVYADSPDAQASTLTPVQVSPAGADRTATTLLVDAWTLALLGGVHGTVLDEVAKTGAKVTFTPLTADALDDLLAVAPGAVAALIARTATSSDDVACTEEGCTVDGEDFDLAVLERLDELPGLGPVYAAAGIKNAVLGARVETSSPLLHVRLGSGSATLDATDRYDTDGQKLDAPAGPANGYKAGVWALGGGLGTVFPLDPMWSRGERLYETGRFPTTNATAAGVADSVAGALLVSSVARPDAAGLVSGLSPSQLTYLTSPTTGCGTVVLCTTEPVTATIDSLKTAGTIACLAEPRTTPEGRAVLLGQQAKVRVTLDRPAIMAGDWASEPTADSLLGFDVLKATPVTGQRSFDQQAVFAIDDSGILAVTGGRNRPALSLGDKQLFGGAFVSCGQ